MSSSDPDPKIKLETDIEVKLERENGSLSETREDKGMRCTSNFEDTTFDTEVSLDQQNKTLDETDDVEIDIIECTNTCSNNRLAEDPDATEYSSSFGDTISGTEDGSKLSDTEVESGCCGANGSASESDRPSRKKLTAHWRRFIRPIMWRCKWIELRIKEFQSQALKYDRELAACDQRKRLERGQFTLEGFSAKSLPFSSQSHRRKTMKRRKRKRAEDTVDIQSYMSCHNLFSYYENKRADADGASVDDDCGNQVIAADQNINGNDECGDNDEWSLFEFRDGDSSLEQIIWKIEVTQSRIYKLKTQLDKVVHKNNGKFSSTENLSLLGPCDAPTSSARSPTYSPGNGDTMQVGALYTPPRLKSEYDMVMPESAVSSYGEATPFPDIIESTVGLLSAADVSLDQPQIGDSCEDIVDDILIHNRLAEGELHNFEKLSSQPIEKPQEPREEPMKESTIPPVPAPEPDPAAKTSLPQEQSTLKSCSVSKLEVPKNKRKRGERRAGSGRWSKRSSGGSDNQ